MRRIEDLNSQIANITFGMDHHTLVIAKVDGAITSYQFLNMRVSPVDDMTLLSRYGAGKLY